MATTILISSDDLNNFINSRTVRICNFNWSDYQHSQPEFDVEIVRDFTYETDEFVPIDALRETQCELEKVELLLQETQQKLTDLQGIYERLYQEYDLFAKQNTSWISKLQTTAASIINGLPLWKCIHK